MYPDWVPAIAGLLVIWLGALSFLIWKQGNFLKLLFPRSGDRDIRKKFEEMVKAVDLFGKELLDLENKVTVYHNNGLQHTQKVELLRFNPYNDTGGDQSFTLCFLNSEGSGIVLTSLHARSGTRVFSKEIKQGKGLKYQLSKEEELVIKKALVKN